MIRLFLILFFASSLCFVGCEPQNSEDNSDDTEMSDDVDNTDDDADDELSAEETYNTKTLNADLPSPRREMRGTVGGAAVVVNYGSPSVKGRNLWGELVPHDAVWRTGANEATTIEFANDVTVEGEELPAGKYAFFTIPKATGAWDVIFNSTADQWGSYDYDETNDALRVTATPIMVDDSSETLEYMIDGDNLVLTWGTMTLPLTVKAS